MARSWRLGWIVVLFASASCGGSSAQVGNAIGAGVTTAIAAGLWAGGVGCSLQGCPWGSFCDDAAKRCVARSCGDGCPTSTYCNEAFDRCQDLPSVTVMNPPNDAPPADQTLQRPLTPAIPYQ